MEEVDKEADTEVKIMDQGGCGHGREGGQGGLCD